MSSWPAAPRTLKKYAERSHSANLYNHSKFAIFNDRSQLDFYSYSLILIILGAARFTFPIIHHQHREDCIVSNGENRF